MPQRYNYTVRVQPRNRKAATFYWAEVTEEDFWKSPVLIAIHDRMGDEVLLYQDVVNRLWFSEHTNGLSMKGGSVGTLRITKTPVNARSSL